MRITEHEEIINPLYDETPIVYLYVKQHSITKLKYFGKYTGVDPHKYQGSGKHWKHHLKKHGNRFIETLKIWSFNYLPDATEFALNFSYINNIVKSAEWANEIPENALDGISKGFKMSEESRRKISKSKKGVKHSAEQNLRQSELQKGRKHSADGKKNQSEAQKNRFSNLAEREKHALGAKKTIGVRVGKKHYNNGIITKTFHSHPGEGWVLGRVPRNSIVEL